MPERTHATTGLAFVMALVAWGTYFYGNSFYLHALVESGAIRCCRCRQLLRLASGAQSQGR